MAKRAPVSRYDNLSTQARLSLANAEEAIFHEHFKSYIGPEDQAKHFRTAYDVLATQLAPFPKLKGPFLWSFTAYSNRTSAQSSRRFENLTSKLRNGFLAFLNSKFYFNIEISGITEVLIKEFTVWMGQQKSSHGTLYANASKRKFYGAILCVLQYLLLEPRFSHLISPDLRVPPNPFPTRDDGESDATEALDDEEWELLIAACKKEVRETIELVKKTSAILGQIDSRTVPVHSASSNRFRDYNFFLIALRKKYQKIIPTLREIGTEDKELHFAIRKIHGGMRAFETGFYPTAPALFPFIFLMFIYTLANRDPLLDIKHSSITRKDVLGVERVVIKFYKPRSHSFYNRSYAVDVNDELSPGRLLDFLADWTRGIRKLVLPQYARHVFIFVSNNKDKVRGFLTTQNAGRSSDSSFSYATTKFLERHGLSRITSKVIRVTGLDAVREQSGEDPRAVQSAGGHKGTVTGDTAYSTTKGKRRNQESLAGAMETQGRWITSDGRIDPRGLPPQADIHSATPGWHCWDPYDSPMPGERKGALCEAYGHCPKCPLGALDSRSPYALARTLQLAEEIRSAQLYLSPKRWVSAWSPALAKLINFWIPAFTSAEVRERAKTLRLRPLGRLE
jgi:hypothetical protein